MGKIPTSDNVEVFLQIWPWLLYLTKKNNFDFCGGSLTESSMTVNPAHMVKYKQCPWKPELT